MTQPAKSLVKEWIDKAESDYEVALILRKRKKKYFYISAFHCQQTIEKSLKALLLCYNINFPKTHDLLELLDLLKVKDPFLFGIAGEFKLLNPFAVGFRYPGEDITTGELKTVIQTTKRLYKILQKRVREFL